MTWLAKFGIITWLDFEILTSEEVHEILTWAGNFQIYTGNNDLAGIRN